MSKMYRKCVTALAFLLCQWHHAESQLFGGGGGLASLPVSLPAVPAVSSLPAVPSVPLVPTVSNNFTIDNQVLQLTYTDTAGLEDELMKIYGLWTTTLKQNYQISDARIVFLCQSPAGTGNAHNVLYKVTGSSTSQVNTVETTTKFTTALKSNPITGVSLVDAVLKIVDNLVSGLLGFGLFGSSSLAGTSTTTTTKISKTSVQHREIGYLVDENQACNNTANASSVINNGTGNGTAVLPATGNNGTSFFPSGVIVPGGGLNGSGNNNNNIINNNNNNNNNVVPSAGWINGTNFVPGGGSNFVSGGGSWSYQGGSGLQSGYGSCYSYLYGNYQWNIWNWGVKPGNGAGPFCIAGKLKLVYINNQQREMYLDKILAMWNNAIWGYGVSNLNRVLTGSDGGQPTATISYIVTGNTGVAINMKAALDAFLTTLADAHIEGLEYVPNQCGSSTSWEQAGFCPN